jgi:hypothetical protein
MNDITTIEQDERPAGVRLTPAEYEATQAKIGVINDRAAKRGFTGRLTVTAERVEETKKDELGFDVTTVWFVAKIGGEAPAYNGWTFLARIDAVGDTFTIAPAPGAADHIDRSLVRPGECDHCGTARFRKNTYLVVNEAGEIHNVGSTCIKDFLGWSGSFAFISEEEATEQFERGFGGGEVTYSFETVVAVAYASVRVWGWVPASLDWKGPTKFRVSTILSGRLPKLPKSNETDPEYLQAAAYADEAGEQAKVIRDFILSDEFSGTSTYVENLKALAQANEVSYRQIGLVASAPNAYTRFLETAADRQARQARWDAEKAAKKVSEYIGSEGDKVEVKGTISAIRYIEGDYGTTTLYTILTTDGNLVKWFASREALGEKEGVEVHIVGTVKKHDDYEGVKSTVLTRAAKVNPLTGKPFSSRKTNEHHDSAWSDEQDRRVYAHETPHKDCEFCYEASQATDKD